MTGHGGRAREQPSGETREIRRVSRLRGVEHPRRARDAARKPDRRPGEEPPDGDVDGTLEILISL